MRRKTSLLQEIAYAPRTTSKNCIGEVIAGWGEKTKLQALVKPLSDNVSVSQYGERINSMRTVIYTGSGPSHSDGVWIEDLTTTDPGWTVVTVDNWPMHTNALVERLT